MSMVELHMHSFFSFLDALASPEELVSRGKDLGYEALALTDHGGLFGVPRFLKAAASAGVKPIVGCEVYVSPTTRSDRSPELRPAGHHLTLLAETLEGYRNLVKLSSTAFAEGFFHRPRVDLELLAQSSKGIILLTGCIHSAFCQRLLQNDSAGAEKLLGFYVESFGRDRVFLEVQRHGLPEEETLHDRIKALAQKYKILRVGTNDVHYLNSSDAPTHLAAMDLRSRKLPTDPRRARFSKPAYGLLTPADRAAAFRSDPESIESPAHVARMCALKPEDIQFPLAGAHESESAQRLSAVVRALAARRWRNPTGEQKERLERELKGIGDAGLADYILRVHELVSESRRQGVLLGPGRGSAAGSLVSYLLDITEIDPLEYGLSFERFISPGRSTLPDIDIDVDQRRRVRVVEILSELDPSARTFRVGTTSTIGLSAAIREVGRGRGMPYREVDEKIRGLPDDADRLDAEDRGPWAESASMINALSKLPKSTAGHPAGVVVVPVARQSDLPVYVSPEGHTWIQYDGDDLEWMGLQKLDLLPLKILAVIAETVRWLKITGSADIDPARIPLADTETFNLLSAGRTLGVFQLESAGMRDLLKDLMPDSILSLAAALALYRPGPIAAGLPAAYVNRKHGREECRPPRPEFESILKETFGLILYQEQVMACARAAGHDEKEANNWRLALSKLSRISPHAAFAFNKAHAVSYAHLVYRVAYLKAHYPAAFLAALANEYVDDRRRLGEIFSEARRLGIRIVPPDVNGSGAECIPQPDARVIRLGLKFVRHVPEGVVEDILRQRPFEDLADLMMKVPDIMKQKSLEMMCKSGALDAFGPGRAAVLESLPNWTSRMSRSIREGGLQADLFEDPREPEGAAADSEAAAVPPVRGNLFLEHEALGCFATASPLDEIRDIVAEFCTASLDNLPAHPSVRERSAETGAGHAGPAAPSVTVAGLLTALRPHTDRAGREMAFATIEDGAASLDAVFFSDAYLRNKEQLAVGAPLLLRGRLEKKGASVNLIADQVVGVDRPDRLYESILLKIDREMGMDVMKAIKQILKEHPGDRPVYIEMPGDSGVFEFRVGWSCRPAGDLRQKLERILGANSVFFLKSPRSPAPSPAP